MIRILLLINAINVTGTSIKIGDFVPIVEILGKRVMLMKRKNDSKMFIVALIVIITALHYTTQSTLWPLHDFYRRLYYLPIILAAFKYRLKGGFLTSLTVILLYAPHMLLYFGEINLEVINQFFEAGMFVIIGMITGFLVEGDFQKRTLLEVKIKQLADLENYTHNVLDSIDSAVFSLDVSNNITTVNRRAEELFKDKEGIMAFINENDFLNIANTILLEKRESYEKELIYNKSGSQLSLFIAAYPLVNINKIIEGVVVVIKDISKLKQLEEELRRSERLSAIGQMASGIAHEIRNPLGIIKTIGQAINKDIKDIEIKEGLEIINDEISRANKVIKELLDFAKPYRLNLEKISINTILQELINKTTKLNNDVVITAKLNNSKGYDAYGDIDKLNQAFINIILNAIEAMKTGGTLDISTEIIEDQWIRISFKDEGEGISEEMLSRIYDPFFTTKDYGTGLGLSITHRIIEEHGGRIEIYSQKNKGTTVRVYIRIFSS